MRYVLAILALTRMCFCKSDPRRGYNFLVAFVVSPTISQRVKTFVTHIRFALRSA